LYTSIISVASVTSVTFLSSISVFLEASRSND
jgi:hypothetical protein